MKSTITSLGTAVPEFKIAQKSIARLMSEILPLKPAEKEKLFRLYDSSGIATRHTVISDFASEPKNFRFFPNHPGKPFPDTRARMELYKQKALPLALNAIDDCLAGAEVNPSEITHLIVISCTGMYAPGLDIEIIEQTEMKTSVQRTGINFMGCYAAFNGMKVADQICRANPEAKVLMVSLELCTLHFNPEPDIEKILVNTLFSDVAAAILVEHNPEGRGFQIESFYNDIAPESKQEMTWDIGPAGFDMRLTPEVPAIIRQGIRQLCLRLMNQDTFQPENVDYYAIHPGGKKILEAIEAELMIPAEKNRPAYHVLEHYGNMSSPTILFVLKALWEQLTENDAGKNVLSFAFGPGLTLESMYLTIKHG